MTVKVKKIQPNPLDWALSKIGMTRAAFGAEIGFGKSYLIRVSQGRHSALGTNVQDRLYKLASEKGIDLDEEILGVYGGSMDLDEAYQWWLVKHRESQDLLPEPTKNAELNPFARLVEAIGGVAATSRLLAAPDPLVERYAKGKTYRMPVPIMMALHDLQYPHVEALYAAMVKWGEEHVQSR